MRRVVPLPFPPPLMGSAADLGRAVRAARTGAGLSLVDAATALGVSKDTLANLETGQGGVSVATALRIAHEMGVQFLAVPSAQAARAALAVEQLRDPPPATGGRAAEGLDADA